MQGKNQTLKEEKKTIRQEGASLHNGAGNVQKVKKRLPLK